MSLRLTALLTVAAPMLSCERPANPASAPGTPNGPQPVPVTVSDPSTATYHPEPMPSSTPPPTVGRKNQERQPDENACLRSCDRYAVCERELFVGRDVSGRLRMTEEEVETERQGCRYDCKHDPMHEDEMKAVSECLRLTDCKAYLRCIEDA